MEKYKQDEHNLERQRRIEEVDIVKDRWKEITDEFGLEEEVSDFIFKEGTKIYIENGDTEAMFIKMKEYIHLYMKPQKIIN